MSKLLKTHRLIPRELMVGVHTHYYAPELNKILFFDSHKLWEFPVPGITNPDEAYAHYVKVHAQRKDKLTYEIYENVSY